MLQGTAPEKELSSSRCESAQTLRNPGFSSSPGGTVEIKSQHDWPFVTPPPSKSEHGQAIPQQAASGRLSSGHTPRTRTIAPSLKRNGDDTPPFLWVSVWKSPENPDFMVLPVLLGIRKDPCITEWSVSPGAKLTVRLTSDWFLTGMSDAYRLHHASHIFSWTKPKIFIFHFQCCNVRNSLFLLFF